MNSSQGVEPVSSSRHPLCRLNAGAEPRNSRIDRNLEPRMILFPSSCSHLPRPYSTWISMGSLVSDLDFFSPPPRWSKGRYRSVRGLLLIFLTGKRETTILSVNEQPRRNFRSGRHCSLLLSRFLLLGILGCIGESRQFLC